MTLTQINKAGLDEIALDHVFTIGASGSSAYTFQGEGLNGTVNNPTLYLTRGKTYRFENGSGGHPIRIQSTSGASGTAYNTGVTNNAGSGTVIVEVQHDAPDVLYYQCTSHAAMNGILYITGALADGGVTTAKIAADAVTGAKIADDAINSEHYTDGSIDTDHIADDAVTAAKIADNAVGTPAIAGSAITSSRLADGAVTGAKIAAEAITLDKFAHGTSSNNGKFLRANNGADPTFETVSGTTINNNADDRVITGSGTANTLNGESNMTYTSNTLKLQDVANDTSLLHIVGQGTSDRGLKIGTSQATGASQNDGAAVYDAINSESNEYGSQHIFRRGGHNNMVIGYQSNNYVGINNDYPDYELSVKATDSNESTIQILAGGNGKESNLLFGAPDDADVGAIKYDHNGDHMKFIVGGSERIKINSNGIQFGGSNGSNHALDDYEEGTWTPSISYVTNGGSPTNRINVYRKIGNMVYFTFDIFQSGNNMGININGTSIITGLPFASSTISSINSTMNIGTYKGDASGQRINNYIDSTPQLVLHGNGEIYNLRHIWGFGCYATS